MLVAGHAGVVLALGGLRTSRLIVHSSRPDRDPSANGGIIARIVCTNREDGLKPKVSKIEVHWRCAHLRTRRLALPCPLSFLSILTRYSRLRSSLMLSLWSKPKAKYPQTRKRDHLMARMKSRRRVMRMKDTLEILISIQRSNG